MKILKQYVNRHYYSLDCESFSKYGGPKCQAKHGGMRPVLRGAGGGRPWPDQTRGGVCVLVLGR